MMPTVMGAPVAAACDDPVDPCVDPVDPCDPPVVADPTVGDELLDFLELELQAATATITASKAVRRRPFFALLTIANPSSC
jgi:hypothetical protein